MDLKRKAGFVFLHYLRVLAKIQLTKINLLRRILGKKPIVVIGITGSCGKTSTMRAAAAALKESFIVKSSEKANSESGIPLNILGLSLTDYSFFDWLKAAILSPLALLTNWRIYDAYIIEMGVDEPTEPKNMGYLLKIIKPEIGVFTGVTSVHSEQFEKVISKNITGSKRLKAVLDAIANEKAKMIAALPEDGFAILNLEDEFVRKRQSLSKAKVLTAEKIKIDFENYVLPDVYDLNFGMAVAVAKALKVDREKAVVGIKKYFVLPPGRSSLIKGIKNTLIIDSSYNSSPKAAQEMLKLLSKLGKKLKRKKVAVLGDMRELGLQSKIEHKKLAKIAVNIAEEIILVGPLMKQYFLPEAQKLKFPKNKNWHFKNAYLAAEFLVNHIKGEELILVKGSQNTIFLEIVVKALMAEKNNAEKLLCRRGKFWERKRKEIYQNG